MHSRTIGAIALALAIGLSACGGGGTTEASAPTQNTSPSAPATSTAPSTYPTLPPATSYPLSDGPLTQAERESLAAMGTAYFSKYSGEFAELNPGSPTKVRPEEVKCSSQPPHMTDLEGATFAAVYGPLFTKYNHDSSQFVEEANALSMAFADACSS